MTYTHIMLMVASIKNGQVYVIGSVHQLLRIALSFRAWNVVLSEFDDVSRPGRTRHDTS